MDPVTIQQVFETAVRHHQAGRLREAENLYLQILSWQPGHIDAMYLLGVIAHQVGRNNQAIDLISRAIALKPDNAEAHVNLGNALKATGQLDAAIAAFRHAIALSPGFPEALNNLGMALQEKGQLDQAVAACRRAVALRPDYAEAHVNLGNALKRDGRLDEALAAYRQALAHRPDYAVAHNNLGNVLKDTGHLGQAIAAYRQAIHCDPAYADACSNFGNALRDNGQLDEAIAACRRAIDLNADFPEAHNNLGNALRDAGQPDGAIAAFGQAILLNPDFPEAHSNLGNALKDMGQLDEAMAAFRRAIALKPEFAQAHFNLAMVLLHRDMQEGWREYEWRFKTPGCPPPHPHLSQPLWDGGDLNGRMILLYTEQGFGETIQFIRYVPMVAARGGRVIVEAQPELIRLLKQLPGVEQWIPYGQPLPAFDVQCPLLSLPRLFGTTLQSIPAQNDLLRADPELVQTWRAALERHGPGLKVGLAWAGNPDFKEDRTRSISLDRLAPLSSVGNVTFYSHQKGAAAIQTEHPPAGLRLVNLAAQLNDFADTAAAMSVMDLVITTDTSVAHLAGATGRPVWVMLQFMPDWRWLLDRSDSPWYPTMRLFRQSSPGGWEAVIERVARELADYCVLVNR